jgi:hypothetical protein
VQTEDAIVRALADPSRRASGTRLELEHTGFETEDRPAFEGAKHGWQRTVGELGEVLAA